MEEDSERTDLSTEEEIKSDDNKSEDSQNEVEEGFAELERMKKQIRREMQIATASPQKTTTNDDTPAKAASLEDESIQY